MHSVAKTSNQPTRWTFFHPVVLLSVTLSTKSKQIHCKFHSNAQIYITDYNKQQPMRDYKPAVETD